MEALSNKQKNYLKIKRINSFIGALIWIPILSPLFLLVLLINLIFTHGHPFFKQIRMGENEKEFTIYKFQTIKDNSTNIWGRFLRFTSLDELPQLINILIGQMNFIGPRPLSILETDINDLRKASDPSPFLVKPGLSGYAQTRYTPFLTSEEKVNNDIYYVNNLSLSLDLKILFLTIFKLLPITIHRKK